jgi:hypothetical protein
MSFLNFLFLDKSYNIFFNYQRVNIDIIINEGVILSAPFCCFLILKIGETK